MFTLDTLSTEWDAFHHAKTIVLACIEKQAAIPFTYPTGTDPRDLLQSVELLENSVRLAEEELRTARGRLQSLRAHLQHDISPKGSTGGLSHRVWTQDPVNPEAGLGGAQVRAHPKNHNCKLSNKFYASSLTRHVPSSAILVTPQPFCQGTFMSSEPSYGDLLHQHVQSPHSKYVVGRVSESEQEHAFALITQQLPSLRSRGW